MNERELSGDMPSSAGLTRPVPDDAARERLEAEQPILFRDVAPALEFVCWVVVALAPFLRWVNGPAVTVDQFIIQVALVSLAAAGAIGLRIYNWRAARHGISAVVQSERSGEAGRRD